MGANPHATLLASNLALWITGSLRMINPCRMSVLHNFVIVCSMQVLPNGDDDREWKQ